MRKVIANQMKLGEIDISQIEFDLRSRDEIPKLLMGLQTVYCNIEVRNRIFALLEEKILKGKKNTGRNGMDLWKILVLGTIRLNCNWDFDKLKEIADNHLTLREMLGHTRWLDETKYPLQTLKDNVSLFSVELLNAVNDEVVKLGHNLLKKKDLNLNARCDSFVVETNVYYPTDIRLLFDAVRKSVELISCIAEKMDIKGWRQSNYHIKQLKNFMRKYQNLKHSTSKDKAKIEARQMAVKAICNNCLTQAEMLIKRVKIDVETVRKNSLISAAVQIKLDDAERFIKHAERQIKQVRERVINGNKIPHDEKEFSIFEEHTEWISKGKAGVPQELGLKVCVLQDQFGFILNHRVMQDESDSDIVVEFVKATKEKFPALKSGSFDKGFHSKENQIELAKILDHVYMPKKGKLSAEEKEREHSKEFVKFRKAHSAVESDINALENHGLDRCPDKGEKGFKRYCAFAVLSRNLQILGDKTQKKKIEHIKRSEAIKAGLAKLKSAA